MTTAAARGFSIDFEQEFSEYRIEDNCLKSREKDLKGKAYQFDLRDSKQALKARAFPSRARKAGYIFSRGIRVGNCEIFWASRPGIPTGVSNPPPVISIFEAHQR